MASLFYEGFDEYGPPRGSLALDLAGAGAGNTDVGSLLTQNHWTTAISTGLNQGYFSIIPGLSETGYALAIISQFGPILGKTLNNNYSRLIGGFRFMSSLTATSGITFMDGSTAQCAIGIDYLTGFITVYAGAFALVLGRSLFSVSALTTHFLEYDITFGLGASGSYQVWIDGVSVVNGLGTTQQTCDASANGIQLNCGSAGAGNPQAWMVYDDMYLFDNTTSRNNQVLLANSRIESQWPLADSQKQWTNNGNIIGVQFPTTTPNGAQNAPGANTLFLRQFTPSVNCTLNAIGILPNQTSATANFKGVVYSDSSGAAGSLLSSGVQVTGCIAGVETEGALTTPQNLTAGTPYWIGMITDTSISLYQETDQTSKGVKATNTYGSGAPGTAPAMTVNQASWLLWGECTGATTNFQSMNVNPPAGDDSSIQSATVGQEDLYTFPALSADITTVYGVMASVHAKLQSTGTRTISVQLKSNATDSSGTLAAQTPQTSYGWFDTMFDADPNGTINWTKTAVGLATTGPKVAS